jgi:glycosyltransferase involved in cell wall biosynthesis
MEVELQNSHSQDNKKSVFYPFRLSELTLNISVMYALVMEINMVTNNKPRILIACLSGKLFGGGEMHALTLYKMLRAAGYHTTMLVNAHTALHRRLITEGLPCHSIRLRWLQRNFRSIFCFLIARKIRTICTQEKIDIIHCNSHEEVKSAAWASQRTYAKVIFTRHIPDHFTVTKIKGTHASIGVTPEIAHYIEQENIKNNIGLPAVLHIPPFFDAGRLDGFIPNTTREDFFSINFGVTIKPLPLFCVIGNMVPDLQHKSHPLLFKALTYLINTLDSHAQVVLAGDGPMRPTFERMVKEQGLAEYVHFLGATDKIPGILYHSDFLVLPSIKEAFGLVYTEAGMMRRAAIGAYGTGAEIVLRHEHTGLLFKNGDAHDLACAIKRLIDNPTWTQQLGNQAHERVMKNFAPLITFEQHELLYAQLAQQQQPL